MAAAALVAFSCLRYAADVARGRARPRVVSWALWTASMGTSAAGAGMCGQAGPAALAGAGSAGCAVVLAAGVRFGDRAAGRLDLAGLAAGCAGLGLLGAALAWPGAVPMWAAVAAAVGADAAAFTPSWVNGWRGGEPAGPYVLFGVAAVLAMPGADQAAGLIFPVYEVAACAVMVVLAVAAPAGGRHAAGRGSAVSAAGEA